jgi:hypothetical protein
MGLRGILLAIGVTLAGTAGVGACPFCTAESRTLSEELGDSNVAILAQLVKPALPPEEGPQEGARYGTVDPETGAARFRVVDVLVGAELMEDVEEIEAIFFGDPTKETLYLIRGIGTPPDWTIPLGLSDIAVDYLRKLQTLPAEGADRLAFFMDYLEHADPLLAQDAYDEFAGASYQAVKDLKDRMDKPQLLRWIESSQTSPSRKRLFLTMLGVCGGEEDLPRLEAMLFSDVRPLTAGAETAAAISAALGGPLSSALAPEAIRMDERQKKLGLDAMVACYLTIAGGDALDRIDERFLKDPQADYTHIYSTLMALRFLAEEGDIVPVERVLASARLLLDNPDFADQVIPDLARWEDWSVLDRLVDLYARTDELGYQKYVREPIVTYLDVAAEQGGDLAVRAEAALAKIEPLDPAAFRRARSLRAFGFLAQARPASDLANAVRPDDPAAVDETIGTDPGSDEIPDPVDLAESPPSEGEDAADEPSGPAGVEGATAAPQASLAETAPPVVPNRWLLLGAPLAGAAICFGLFWLILRGGAA